MKLRLSKKATRRLCYSLMFLLWWLLVTMDSISVRAETMSINEAVAIEMIYLCCCLFFTWRLDNE